ncbi:efflux RND transporter periplasmic adaptor subunit [Oleiharenicola lentus]|uniref:efflux RND transporter periplasmic adaptor subunit n=1 Tax=Oleiharenicola lentus TaxID=2508720 RepID=UPI003F66BC56
MNVSTVTRLKFFAFVVGCLTNLVQAHAADALRFDGLVLPFKEVVISSPVQSSIQSIHFKEGDTVKAGDVLAKLYGRIEELDMQRTKAALEKREFDFKGSKNLYADKIISEDEALKNRIELDLARLQAEQATELFNQRTLVAPINGLLVERMREVGESVTATQPMFRIVDIDQVYVQFYLHSEQLGRLQVGDNVKIRCSVAITDGTTGNFAGKVDFIDPRVDAASGLLRVKVLVPNPKRVIKPGLRADVIIE